MSHRPSDLSFPTELDVRAVWLDRWLIYLPTLWAFHSRGDSSQYSLLTWLAWVGLNVTVGAWLFAMGTCKRRVTLKNCLFDRPA